MAEIAELIFQADTAQLEKAEKQLDKINKTGVKTEKVTASLNTGTKKLSDTFGEHSHKIRNASFQLQDIVVQLEAGVPVTRTLAQQLPQLLSEFGAFGAVAGLVAGLGFALAGPLVSSIFDTEDATKKLEKAMDDLSLILKQTDEGAFELTDTFRKLAQVGGVSFSAALKEAMSDAKDAISAAREEALKLSEAISPSELGGRFDKTKLRVELLNAQFQEGRITLQDYAKGLNEISLKDNQLTTDFRELREKVLEQAEASKSAYEQLQKLNDVQAVGVQTVNEHQASIDRLIQNLEVQSQATLDAANDTDYYRAKQLGASEAELQRISSLEALIRKSKEAAAAELEAKRQAERAADEANRREEIFQRRLFQTEDFLRAENDAYKDAYNERLSIINAAETKKSITEEEAADLRKKNDQVLFKQRAQNYSDFFGQISTLQNSGNRKLFEIGKAAAIAQATIDGTLAVQKALSSLPPPANFVVATAVGAAAAANVGAIAAQRMPGRAQGGQVRPGEAYRVGEFGPETLVMGSRGGVIAPNIGGTGGIQVMNNVKVIGGNGDAKVSSNGRQINDKQFVVDIVVDLMANQSSPARNALHSTSNVTPRGRR